MVAENRRVRSKHYDVHLIFVWHVAVDGDSDCPAADAVDQAAAEFWRASPAFRESLSDANYAYLRESCDCGVK